LARLRSLIGGDTHTAGAAIAAGPISDVGAATNAKCCPKSDDIQWPNGASLLT